LQLEETIPLIAELMNNKLDSQACIQQVAKLNMDSLRGMTELSYNIEDLASAYSMTLRDLDFISPVLTVGSTLTKVQQSGIKQSDFVLALSNHIMVCEALK